MKGYEIKSFNYEVRGLDDKKGIVEFYASSFRTHPDSDNDIIVKGAFKKTIDENEGRIKHLLNHDRTIGVPIEFKEDDFGLFVRSQLIMGKQLGREAFEEYKVYAELKKSMEHSIGYKTIKKEDTKEGGRILKELMLRDVTTMETWGADDNTPQLALKGVKNIDDTIELLERMLSAKFSDEKLTIIENKIIELKSLINNEPQISTLKDEPMGMFTFLNNNLKF